MIDIKSILAQMKGAMALLLPFHVAGIQQTVTDYLLSSETELSNLAAYRISGDISDKFLKDRLAEEGDIMLTQLLSFAVITKEIAQEAIDKAFGIFITNVTAAVPQ